VFETDKVQIGDQNFGEMLKSAIEKVNNLQVESNNQMYKMALGEVQDIHEVMIAMEKASISMQLTMEIRNKVIEGFNSLMKTAM